jgi:hypothetical protein
MQDEEDESEQPAVAPVRRGSVTEELTPEHLATLK